MAKNVTLKKPKTISGFKIPIGKLKKGIKTTPLKISSQLKNPSKVLKSLALCLKNNDVEGFKEILNAHIELTNKKAFSKKIGIGRATLYEALGPNGNPSIATVARIVHALAA